MFLLDTNVISEVRKGRNGDTGVASWYASVEESKLFISALVPGEIRRGIELARGRHDLRQGDALDSWLQALLKRFSERVLPVDSSVADTWGRISALRPVPVIDGLLAATAMVHGKTLVTRNISDVQGLGVELLNPFAD